MEKFEFCVNVEDNGKRIDKFLCEKMPKHSRNFIQNLIYKEKVSVNDEIIAKNYLIKTSDMVEIKIDEPVQSDISSENIPLEIAYTDEDLMIINKPKGMVVHPAAGNFSGTLVNALLHHCNGELSGINGVLRPGIVHRIDKDTSGLLLIAKNDFAHNCLAEQLKNHSIKREYEAIIYGELKENKGTIKTLIGRHKIDRKKMSVVKTGGKLAITHFEVIKRYKNFTHIRFNLETGRTHQIRVHMAFLGCPIIGDEVYSRRENPFDFLKGQCLHARNLGFVHPRSLEFIEFSSELPGYFKKVLNIIS